MIPHTFLPVRPQDFSITPFKVYKRYTISNTDWSSSGYVNHEGLFSSLKTPISSSKAINDPRNYDGRYKHIIWQSINQRYYKYPYDPCATFEHSNRRWTYKNLFLTASILTFPQHDFGESIKKNSIEITSSGLYINDDGYGNLYDKSFITSSFTNRNNLLAYWGFNDLYKYTRYGIGYKEQKCSVPYLSHVFEPDNTSLGKNLYIQKGVTVHTPKTGSGLAVGFRGETVIATHHRPDFNFATNQDFTYSFFIKLPVSQSTMTGTTNTIISKRGTIRKTVYGNLPHLNANGSIINTHFESSSIENQNTNIYPYHFEVYNQTAGGNSGKLIFKRSDGSITRTLTTTASIANNQWQHISVTKNNSNLKLYVNGLLHASSGDVIDHPNNDHMLIFGSENIDYKYGFSGSLDEIRMYNYCTSTASIQTLCERESGYLYQTSAIGNAFYKNGSIVISSLLPSYNKIFNNDSWNVKYRNTHTIYQMETWIRIKKGSGNLTMNPTARQNPDSDMYINDFTGSLLTPYITNIGLYNQKGELLAVAKTGQPVQMRSDVDITFKINMDL